jgi:hypothetical protein
MVLDWRRMQVALGPDDDGRRESWILGPRPRATQELEVKAMVTGAWSLRPGAEEWIREQGNWRWRSVLGGDIFL